MNENKIDKIHEALEELSWDDEQLPGVMEGFFNSPADICDVNKCSEDHLEFLWDHLQCELEDED